MASATAGTVTQMRDFRSADVGKQVNEALSSASQALSSVSETVFDEWQRLSVRAKKAAYATDEFVQQNPWAAAGVAAAVGIAAGFYLARAVESRSSRTLIEQDLTDG